MVVADSCRFVLSAQRILLTELRFGIASVQIDDTERLNVIDRLTGMNEPGRCHRDGIVQPTDHNLPWSDTNPRRQSDPWLRSDLVPNEHSRMGSMCLQQIWWLPKITSLWLSCDTDLPPSLRCCGNNHPGMQRTVFLMFSTC